MMKVQESYMDLAVKEAAEGMKKREGGPFGAVVVLDGKIVGKGHNTVLLSRDPTAHAEVNAIRDACTNLGTHRLEGAQIYSNFEPCPMCLSAIYWAGIEKLWYCADRKEAEKAGFMDSHLYGQMCLPESARTLITGHINSAGMQDLLTDWQSMEDKQLY